MPSVSEIRVIVKLKKQTDMMDDAGEMCMKTLHFYSLSVSLFNLFLPPSVPAGLIISLQLLRGDMEQVRRENPLIFSRGVAMTRKLGFPDVIMPGESMASTSGLNPVSLHLLLHSVSTVRFEFNPNFL